MEVLHKLNTFFEQTAKLIRLHEGLDTLSDSFEVDARLNLVSSFGRFFSFNYEGGIQLLEIVSDSFLGSYVSNSDGAFLLHIRLLFT